MDDTYQFKLGNFQCLAIRDGEIVGNSGLLFANASEKELRQVLQRYGLESNHLPSTWTCLLVKTPTNIVLIDTGIGSGGMYGGQLLPALRAEGFAPEDIDSVILTHAHPDHIGGAVDERGSPSFPQATYYMWQDEWDFWTNQANLAKVPVWAAETARQKLPPLTARLETVKKEIEIVPGIFAVAASGHTVGHMALELRAEGRYLLYQADVALHPIHIEYPHWYAQLDQIPEQTVTTRRAIYERAVETKALVLAFHFPPFPSLGHIVRQDTDWKWQPLQ